MRSFSILCLALMLTACSGKSHTTSDSGTRDSGPVDAPSDVIRLDAPTTDAPSIDAPIDAPTTDAPPTTCDQLGALSVGAACVGDSYCLDECVWSRCLGGIVSRGNTCTADAGLCEGYSYNVACGDDSDCAVAWFPDCCGGAEAHGIISGDMDEFLEYAGRCSPDPVCDCALGYRDENGTLVDGTDALSPRCVDGSCVARVPGCESADDCAEGQVCCYPCGIPGCENVCQEPCEEGPGCGGGCPQVP